MLPKGGLAVVKVGASRPLLLKLTATEEDAIGALTELRQPNGRYRLDPVDGQGRTCGAVHTVLDYARAGDAEDSAHGEDEGASPGRPGSGGTDKVVIDSLLGTIKELAAANASTSARIGEALAINAHNNGGDKLGGFVEGFARLVSLANESVPREVLMQQPQDAAAAAAARSGGAEHGGALGAMMPHLGPVVAAKAGALVDALIARMRHPSNAPPPWPRNGFPEPLPQLPALWPPPPAFRFAGSSSSADAAATTAPISTAEGERSDETRAAQPNAAPSGGGAS
jgi:hypothetical protein